MWNAYLATIFSNTALENQVKDSLPSPFSLFLFFSFLFFSFFGGVVKKNLDNFKFRQYLLLLGWESSDNQCG